MSLAPRPAALVALAAGVLAVHLMLADQVLDSQLGEGARQRGPRRIEVAFVSELRPTAPPAAAATQAVPRTRVQAAPGPRAAASAPQASAAASGAGPENADVAVAPMGLASAPEAQVPDAVVAAASAPPAVAEAPTAAPVSASAPVAAAPSASAPLTAVAPASAAPGPASSFEWPLSTRLTYSVTGNYRGPVNGRARVEWLRDGPRYQVHLEVAVGPSFAPLLSRRMSSDGVIGDDGLQPRRYDEETRAVLREPRRQVLEFHDDRVLLANGQVAPRPPGVQDTASQFVQLTWLFRTRPQLLQAGQVVGVQLALPRYVDLWVYDVLGTEPVATPVGTIDAVHVRPRRPARARNDLTAEMWVAPTLQYLPVRFVIRQDEETYVDLLLDRLPQQAAEAASAPR